MEPQPPRKPKENRPFYAPPEDKPIAVQIINEARSSLKDLKTKRPFTPRDEKRTLFGPRTVNASDNRPPSAFRYYLSDNDEKIDIVLNFSVPFCFDHRHTIKIDCIH